MHAAIVLPFLKEVALAFASHVYLYVNVILASLTEEWKHESFRKSTIEVNVLHVMWLQTVFEVKMSLVKVTV